MKFMIISGVCLAGIFLGLCFTRSGIEASQRPPETRVTRTDPGRPSEETPVTKSPDVRTRPTGRQETPRKEERRDPGDRWSTELERFLSMDSSSDKKQIIKLGHERPDEILVHLIGLLEASTEERRTARILFALRELALHGMKTGTGQRIVDLVGSGDLGIRSRALELAAMNADPKGVELVLTCLQSSSNEGDEKTLRARAVVYARYTGSQVVANELNAVARQGSYAALQSLAHLGFGSDVSLLETLVQTSQDKAVRSSARVALEAAQILASSNRKEQLVQALSRPPSPDGWISWPSWALDKIERMGEAEYIVPLRAAYKAPFPTALPDSVEYRDHWNSHRLKILFAIQKLGGALSAEESQFVRTAFGN